MKRTKHYLSVVISLITAFVLTCFAACSTAPKPTDTGNDTCTVVFFEEGGSSVAPQTVKSGGKVVKPTDPTRPGYNFDGWYTDLGYGTEWDFDTDTVTAATLNLYAKWTESDTPIAQCVVTFNSNGGSNVAQQTVEVGGKVVKPADPTRSGYAFVGWYKNSGLSSTWNFDVDTVSGAAVTLYAKWTANGNTPIEPISKCTVTFDSNGGSAVAQQSVDVGGKVVKPTDPTRSGYTFVGWYKESGCVTAWNFASDTVSGNAITLYAKWTQNSTPVAQCVVTFNSNGGSNVAQQTVDVGGKVVKPADPTRSGYTFGGWYKESGCVTAWNFASDTVSGNAITLYAKWTQNSTPVAKCVVTFNSNGGSAVSQQTVNVGSKVTQPTNPTRSGYTFGGWYKDSSCLTPWDFANDTASGSTLTLYAKWNSISTTGTPVTVTFNVGLDARKDGVYNPAAINTRSGSTISAPQVSRSGCTLLGWYVENGTQKWDFNTDTVPENNMTLFAKWSGTGTGIVGGGGEAVAYTPTMTASNTLYIHYKRSDGNYSPWSLWVWTTGSGTQYTDYTTDISGAVYAIPLSAYGSATTINFLVAQINNGNWGAKDGEDNNSVSLSATLQYNGSYHWFVTSGNVINGKNYLAAEDSSLHATQNNVDRSYAKNLPTMPTVDGWDEMGVGYQIFVASFCDSDGNGIGDIQGIISKLDYLDSLNVDVLWLTPVQSSNSLHGYDCYDYYAINTQFGTNADYRELVYKAHQKGMKIIMDLVVNHTSEKNEWFLKSKAGAVETVTYQDGTTAKVDYRNFYRWSNSGGDRYYSGGDGWYFYSSFGSNMPELNYDCQEVRNAMVDVAAYWMNYGLDGFRMDAIKHMFMWDESSNESGDVEGGAYDRPYNYNRTKDVEFFKEFNYRLKTKYPTCFLLGEQLSGDANEVAPFYAGMDSLFDFNTYYNLPGYIKNNSYGTVSSTFNGNASLYRNYRGDMPINGMITSNHDIPRLSYQFGNNTAQMKLYFAIMLTMPGLHWIYYGDEIGLQSAGSDDNTFRQSMKWTSSWANVCQNSISATNLNGSTVSVADQESDSGSLLSYVKKLTAFRDANPALISGTATCSTENGMLKITVTKGSTTLKVYHNLSGSSQTVSGNVVFGSNTVQAYGTAIVM